jgi:hypothetical protein
MAAALAAGVAGVLAGEVLLAKFLDLDQMLMMCGFTNAVEHARLIEYERFASLNAFSDYTDMMSESMANKNEKRTPAAICVHFGIQWVLYVKAVSFWVCKQHCEGIPVSIDNLNLDMISQMVQEMNLECNIDVSANEDKVGQLAKFDPKKYVTWAWSFENYLDSLHGKLGVPLSYILHPEDANPAQAADDYQHIFWSAPFSGSAFREDNHCVYWIYKDLMIGTNNGWTWFNHATLGDGCDAHLIITHHYHGDAETALCAAKVEASLNRLHYHSKVVFPFEHYITWMSKCFELMEDNQQGFLEPQKVKKMLDGVVSMNAEVVAIKAVVHLTHSNDFNHASTLMSGQIALLFPAATSDLQNKHKISAVVVVVVAMDTNEVDTAVDVVNRVEELTFPL